MLGRIVVFNGGLDRPAASGGITASRPQGAPTVAREAPPADADQTARLQALIANITKADAAAVLVLTQPRADVARESYTVVTEAYSSASAYGEEADNAPARESRAI